VEIETRINRILFSGSDHPLYNSISIYFQGCDAEPKCEECHNPETWDFDVGNKLNYTQILNIVLQDLRLLASSHDKFGLVFLGGEPLAEPHRPIIQKLSKDIKEIYGDKCNILLYSWRMPKDIKSQRLQKYIKNIDLFVLGRYVATLHVDSFPASSNQMYITNTKLFNLIGEEFVDED
jgi:anaerobic ribonucleoside-triphosphate reductase activating protein